MRLERISRPRKGNAQTFQFHKGAIRTLKCCILTLKSSPFQFHKGAIRTIKAHFGVTPPDKFQFHKGAIRTISSLVMRVLLIYFNSIKVRLEPAPFTPSTDDVGFQFHKGAIRTRCTLKK